MNIFDVIYSTEMSRKIFYRLSSWPLDEWKEIQPYEIFRVEGAGESVSFKIVVDNVSDNIFYRFVSLMIKQLDETYTEIWF